MKLINVLMVIAGACIFCLMLGCLGLGAVQVSGLTQLVAAALALSIVGAVLTLKVATVAVRSFTALSMACLCLSWFTGCGSGEQPSSDVSSVNSQDQNVVININDPNCQLDEIVDCDQFVVNLTCNGTLAGARAATCDECPLADACAVPAAEG